MLVLRLGERFINRANNGSCSLRRAQWLRILAIRIARGSNNQNSPSEAHPQTILIWAIT